MAPIDRETVIVDRGRSSAGSIIIGLIVAIALIAIAYLVFLTTMAAVAAPWMWMFPRSASTLLQTGSSQSKRAPARTPFFC